MNLGSIQNHRRLVNDHRNTRRQSHAETSIAPANAEAALWYAGLVPSSVLVGNISARRWLNDISGTLRAENDPAELDDS